MPDKPATSDPAVEPAPAPEPTGAAVPPSTPSTDDLLAQAQARAPHLDAAFVKKHNLDDDYLRAVAGGQEPPPPYNGPDTSATDQHRTEGGWQITPAGVAPEDVGKDQVGR